RSNIAYRAPRRISYAHRRSRPHRRRGRTMAARRRAGWHHRVTEGWQGAPLCGAALQGSADRPLALVRSPYQQGRMRKPMRYSQLAVISAAFLVAFGLPAASQNNNNSDTYEQLRLFGDIFEKVRADYVEEVTDQQLVENAINGMLSSLDPHSSYLNAKDFEEMQVQTKGEFGEVGIEGTTAKRRVTVCH